MDGRRAWHPAGLIGVVAYVAVTVALAVYGYVSFLSDPVSPMVSVGDHLSGMGWSVAFASLFGLVFGLVPGLLLGGLYVVVRDAAASRRPPAGDGRRTIA